MRHTHSHFRAARRVALAAALAALLLSALVPANAVRARDDDELARTVAMMAKVGFANTPSFSPDGRQLAFVTNLSGLPQVWTMPAAGGYPVLVTAFDDPVGFVRWSPAGDWLAFNVAPGGGLNEQIYVVRPDGSGLRRLTEGGKENNFLGDWTSDGRHIFFSSNRRDPASTDSYLLDVATGQARMIAENKGVGGVEDVSRDGRYAVINRLVNRGDNNLYLVSLADGKEVLLTPHEGPGEFDGALFSKDGRTVYLARGAGRVRRRALLEGRAHRLPRLEQGERPHRVRARAAQRGGAARPRRGARGARRRGAFGLGDERGADDRCARLERRGPKRALLLRHGEW